MAYNKDAYYFPHFSNARHDIKIRRLRKELGIEGYGIYFMLLEVIRDQPAFKYPLSDIDLLADEFGTSEAKITTVINNYALFVMDDSEMFFSPKFNEYMQPYLDKSERGRQAALARWGNKSNANAYANALPEQNKCNADQNTKRIEENRIEKNIKEDKKERTRSKKFIKPSIEDIQSRITEMGYSCNADGFYNYYESNGWMVGKNKMKDWKASLAGWESRQKQFEPKGNAKQIRAAENF